MAVPYGTITTGLARIPAISLLRIAPDIELGAGGADEAAARVATRTGARGTIRRTAGTLGPLVFLVATGACLGLSTNLATLAGRSGLPPLAFLAWSVGGASALLFALAAVRGELPPLDRRTVEYFVLSAFFTIAATNLIFVSAIPHAGAGFVAPMAALPPLLTYAGALALRLERFDGKRALGVLLALGGASWIAFVELSLPDAARFWIALALLAPVLLAIGNLYRTLRWPAGISAESLAPGMLGAAALMLVAAGLLPHPAFSLALPTDRVLPGLLVAGQTIVFAAQFVLLLELQRRGGPVYLSLIGSVGALIGVPVAVLLLGEPLPAGLALGAVLIVSGVLLLNAKGKRRNRRPSRRTGRTVESSGVAGRVGSREARRFARPDPGMPDRVAAIRARSRARRRIPALPHAV